MSIEPKHKFNSGMGATMCRVCDSVITNGHTEDLICIPCQRLILAGLMKLEEFDEPTP